MEDNRLPKIVLYSELSTGHRVRVALKSVTKTVSKRPLPHAMLTPYASQTWLRTVMPGAIRSSRWLASLKMTEEMHKETEMQKEI